MKRKSCIQFNTHRKDKPVGCLLGKVCSFQCWDYFRKGCNKVVPTETQIKTTKRELAKKKREHEAFLRACSLPQLIKEHRLKTNIKPKSKVVCPNEECGNDVSEDIIRLRDGLYQCRKCDMTFVKADAVDSFDFDGLDEDYYV